MLLIYTGSFTRLYATLRIKLTRLLAGVGRKLGLTKRFTGAWILRLKNPGKRRELLLPTSTSTTS